MRRICNIGYNKPAELTGKLQGAKVKKVSGRVLTTKAMKDHKTFKYLEAVKQLILKILS